MQRKKRATAPVAATVAVLLSASTLAGAITPLRNKVYDVLQEVDGADATAAAGSVRGPANKPSPSAAPHATDSSRPWIAFTEHAHAALALARDLEQQDSTAHVALAEEQALTWAQAARDLQRTVLIEHQATRLERDLLEARRTLDRAETLLEETSIRRARAEAQLKRLDQSLARTSTPARESKVTQ